MAPTPEPDSGLHPDRAWADAALRAVRKHRHRMARKLDAIRGDLAEASKGPLYRRYGEALLSYLRQVPARAASVALPDPAEHGSTLEIPLDPALNAQGNAARYFKRAAKCARGLEEIPQRMKTVEAEVNALSEMVDRLTAALEAKAEPASPLPREVIRELDAAAKKLPLGLRQDLPKWPAAESGAAPGAPGSGPRGGGGTPKPTAAAIARGEARAPSARHAPRRLKTREGWDVMIGRNNEGNDYVTHHLARPEDYWFHVHGASGSHVVLRRGKGKDEPSKQTIEEVASWAAFYSQARTAGRVPVIFTQKKYVRKPRKAPPGLVVCEREKTVMVRPVEPERSDLADEAGES